jgi:hypothetical protein
MLVCCAGLSMDPPGSPPLARTVAERCVDKYSLESDPNCDVTFQNNLGALADLLCLCSVSTATKGGRRVDIDLGPLGATSVVIDQGIHPMPVSVLRNIVTA